MPHVTVETLVAAAAEDVFAVSQDYDARLEWDPFLRDLRFVNGSGPGIGRRVWVKARSGIEMTAEYVVYRSPELVGVKMIDGPAIFRTFGATWRFTPEGASRSRITFQYSFTLKRWTLPPISHRIAEWIFRRDMRKRIEALRRYAEQRLTIGGQS